jgi:hypothetical protein
MQHTFDWMLRGSEVNSLEEVLALPRGCTKVICGNTDDKMLEAVAAMPDLESLRTYFSDSATVAGIACLSQCQSLRKLQLEPLSQWRELRDETLEPLLRQLSLEWLDISCWSGISDDTLIAISRLPRLRAVNIEACYCVTDQGVCALANNCDLEMINLTACEEITDRSVAALSHCPHLRVLMLPGFAEITDAAFQQLGHHGRQLEILELCPIEEITSKGIQALSGCANLKCLSIFGFKHLEESDFQWLLKLSQLEHLQLDGPPLSMPFIKRLKEAKPALRVEYLE